MLPRSMIVFPAEALGEHASTVDDRLPCRSPRRTCFHPQQLRGTWTALENAGKPTNLGFDGNAIVHHVLAGVLHLRTGKAIAGCLELLQGRERMPAEVCFVESNGLDSMVMLSSQECCIFALARRAGCVELLHRRECQQ
eukprot:NODE_21711_length_740_cov_3.781403.p2 GENE.NODE_21711_length_740_cov_3.781403~~NODE_21711_length_740_cov_3.781403.p2  ORF type:complete len:139 (-),score=10.43 NODE_21711_length_740_cov_3.781403:255-671(-)